MTELRFLGDLSLINGLSLALLVGGFCYWLYRRETLRAGLAYGRLLPWLRSIAVGIIVLMLTGPTLQNRWREGKPGQLTIVIDDSASMSLTDGSNDSRFTRAVNGLLNADPDLLHKLSEVYEVKVVRGSSHQTTELWSSSVEQQSELPQSGADWQPSTLKSMTQFDELLDQDTSSVLVLLSDGQVNRGNSLIEAAQQRPFGQRPIFTVGLGQSKTPPDLSITTIEHPDRLFRHDTLTGKLVLRDTMPSGQPFRVQAWHKDILAWEQTLTTQGSGQRSVSFSFPIEQLVTDASHNDAPKATVTNLEIAAIPIELHFRIVDSIGEMNTMNNHRDIQIWGDLHRSRVLLMDGRSRWESRYLKNVFERDLFWDVNAVISEPAEVLGGDGRIASGNKHGQFPDKRDDLMDYDLVIIGEMSATSLSHQQQQWLVDFVVNSGGGLIIIDGRRDAWSALELGLLSTLLPVRRLPSDQNDIAEMTTVHLTSRGRALAVLNIGNTHIGESSDTWSELPPFQWISKTEAIPGSEVLASSKSESTDETMGKPIFVSRLQGAGRVFYSASDETWRWRYKVADQVHQRFWNQIARWIMRTPYVVEGEFVSLDAGRMTYSPEQEIEIRCRLKKDDLTPLKDADVEAIIRRGNETVLVINLTADKEVSGVYRGTAANLASGNYTVSLTASGVPREALAAETRFVIAEQPSIELDEQTCDLESLRRVAELTGGELIPENEIPTLIDRLKPLSQGRIVQSETLLSQSYLWFFPVIACLSIEWWIRKRVGLI